MTLVLSLASATGAPAVMVLKLIVLPLKQNMAAKLVPILQVILNLAGQIASATGAPAKTALKLIILLSRQKMAAKLVPMLRVILNPAGRRLSVQANPTNAIQARASVM